VWVGAAVAVVALAVGSRDEEVARTVDQLESLVGPDEAIVSHRLQGGEERTRRTEAVDCSREYIPGTICDREEDRRRLGLPDPPPLGPVTQSTLPDPPDTPFIAPDEGPVEADPTAQLEQTVQVQVFREDEPPPTTDTTAPEPTDTTAPVAGPGEGAGRGVEVAGEAQEPGGARGPLPRTGGGWLALVAVGLALILVGAALAGRFRQRNLSSPA
jgi:LPXTG-motif cell wall-anchored protein